jgi:hypothetical protein
MPETGTIPLETRERLEKIGATDVVVGLLAATRDQPEIDATIERVRESVATLSDSPRAVVVVHAGDSRNPPALAPQVAAQSDSRFQILAYPSIAHDPSAMAQSLTDGFRVIFTISQNLGARACCVIASDLPTVTTEWISRLVEPVVTGEHVLVAPCYARHRFEALINRSIIYPLVRALYGKQVRNPLGPDFGLSSQLLQRIMPGIGAFRAGTSRIHPIASLTPEAVIAGLPVCQSHVGVRAYATPDWTGLGALLAQILGPLFIDIERHAAAWQRIRGSQRVPEFGQPLTLDDSNGAVDVTRLIESFQLGARNLQEIWGMILPPSTLVDLRKLARATRENFSISDELWARIVYDFALGHRLRTINRDHLLRAITPLYLGWVASYALELENSGPDEAEWRLEKLCLAWENAKPYFVSRWRWPDRFNA